MTKRRKETLREMAERSLDERLAALLALASALDDCSRVDDLHQLRIAAKRLRYAVEAFSVCFGGAKGVLRLLASLQEDLGAIHDLDVLLAMLRDRLAARTQRVEEEAIAVMGGERPRSERSNALRGLLYADARDRRRIGLLGLLGEKTAERERLFRAASARWTGGQLEELTNAVRALTRPSGVEVDLTPPSPS